MIAAASSCPTCPPLNTTCGCAAMGLIDSPKTKTTPGKIVNLKAVPAPDKKSAAQYYPAQYWFAMLQIPPKSDFPGTGEQRKWHLGKHPQPG